MGSFNTTCFASQQTIAPNDKCRVVAIRQSSTFNPVEVTFRGKTQSLYGVANSTCYVDAFWKPITGLIPAEYDDYGRVKVTMSNQSKAEICDLLAALLRDDIAVAQGENPSHDHAFNLNKFMFENTPVLLGALQGLDSESVTEDDLTVCWDHIWEIAQEHRLFISAYGQELRPLQFAILHEDAYQSLVDYKASQTTYRNQSMAMPALIDRAIASGRERAARYLEFISEREHKTEVKAMGGFAFSDGFREALRCGNDALRNGAGDEIISHESGLFFAGKISQEQLLENIKESLADRYALSSLDELGVRLSPIVYAGQDYQNSIGQEYASFVAKVSKQVCRSRNVSMFGPYKAYAFMALNQASLVALVNAVKKYDAAVELVKVTPATHEVDGKMKEVLEVEVSATMDLNYFEQLMTEDGDDLMKQTFSALAG